MSDVHEVLCKARNLIGREGWSDCGYRNELSGGVCLVGALGLAVGGCATGTQVSGSQDGMGAYRVLAELAGVQSERPSDYRLARWNDQQTETIILRLLDRAIAATAPAPDLQLTTPDEDVPVEVLVHG